VPIVIESTDNLLEKWLHSSDNCELDWSRNHLIIFLEKWLHSGAHFPATLLVSLQRLDTSCQWETLGGKEGLANQSDWTKLLCKPMKKGQKDKWRKHSSMKGNKLLRWIRFLSTNCSGGQKNKCFWVWFRPLISSFLPPVFNIEMCEGTGNNICWIKWWQYFHSFPFSQLFWQRNIPS
jgi:hypothetical protein